MTSQRKYTPELEAQIAMYAEVNGRAAAAQHFDMTPGQVGGLCFRYKAVKKHAPLFDHPIAPRDPERVTGSAMIVGDVHVPSTDYELSRRMMFVAMNYLKEPRQLIIAGDLFNLDFASAYQAVRNEPPWKAEKRAAQALMKEWLTVFDRIYFIAGNHDRRIEKATGGNFSMEDLMAMITHDKRVIVSEWGHCLLTSGGRSFRVTHGRQYSVNTGTVGGELANKYQTNIISHHQHHGSISQDKFKRFIVVDNPAMVDQAKLAYVSLDDSKSPNMARGFCMVRDGEPQLFVEGITVWKHWIPSKRKTKPAVYEAAAD